MKKAISIMTVMVMMMTVMVMMIRMGESVVMMMANQVTEIVMIIRLGPSLLVCKKVQLHNNTVWVYRDGIVHIVIRQIFA